jgi:hypothetical protein
MTNSFEYSQNCFTILALFGQYCLTSGIGPKVGWMTHEHEIALSSLPPIADHCPQAATRLNPDGRVSTRHAAPLGPMVGEKLIRRFHKDSHEQLALVDGYVRR